MSKHSSGSAVYRDEREIPPPARAGVKRWAKYLRRSGVKAGTLKQNPAVYLNAHARRRVRAP